MSECYERLHPGEFESCTSVAKANQINIPNSKVRRKQSIAQQYDFTDRRKSSIQHGGPLYLQHTESSFRRMSIMELGTDPGKKLNRHWSVVSENSENRDDFVDETEADIEEINSEIQRVQHYIHVRNRNLKLDQLQEDLVMLKRTVAFDEESIIQHKKDRKKSLIDNYLNTRRRSVTKSTYL